MADHCKCSFLGSHQCLLNCQCSQSWSTHSSYHGQTMNINCNDLHVMFLLCHHPESACSCLPFQLNNLESSTPSANLNWMNRRKTRCSWLCCCTLTSSDDNTISKFKSGLMFGPIHEVSVSGILPHIAYSPALQTYAQAACISCEPYKHLKYICENCSLKFFPWCIQLLQSYDKSRSLSQYLLTVYILDW